MEDNNKKKSCSISDVKSKYILEQILTILKENRLLNIIRYNTSFQNKLNKSINDYKTIFLKTEIEIEVEKIKSRNPNDQSDQNVLNEKNDNKFINIYDKKYYCFEIYNIDTKEKILRNYITDKEKKIKIIINYDYKDLSGLFRGCKCIKKINFIKLNRNDIVDMSFMFDSCLSLEELNLPKFNTENVTNMSHMFKSSKI